MSESPLAPPRPGPPSRGISPRDVELAADALMRAGERPTIEKVREKIGRGSPNTINPALDAWWKRLGARLDAGPAALHRLPESVAHVAEALWMQALDEARRRAGQELTRDAHSALTAKQDLEVRSHVLTLREGELDSRLKDRERTQAALQTQLQDLTLLLRKGAPLATFWKSDLQPSKTNSWRVTERPQQRNERPNGDSNQKPDQNPNAQPNLRVPAN